MRFFFTALAGILLFMPGGCQAPDETKTAAATSLPPAAVATSKPQPAANCPLCQKPIPRGHEVWLAREGSKPVAYRCVHCALTVQAASLEPSTIITSSPISGSKVTIQRTVAGFTIEPATAVFLSVPEEGGECMNRHKVFKNAGEYQQYLEQHPDLPRAKAHPYTINDLAAILAQGLPASGIRPQAPVQLLVVGMLNHLPFKEEVLPAIKGALGDAGREAGARFVDALAPQGKALLQAHGIHQHLPVIMFLKGQSHFLLGKQSVDLRGFPGRSWTRAKLALLLRRAIKEGPKQPPL